MNKIILTVQGYLLHPEKYTKEQLEQNCRDALASASAAAVAAWASAYDAAAYYAARGADSRAALAAALDAEYWLNEYFRETDESRQGYINAINEGKQ